MSAEVAGRQLLLVTTDDCHLCRHAHEVLAAVDVEVREVDVSSDEAADLAAAGIPLGFLPVVTDGERVLGYGRLSEKRLRKEFAR
jgi:glutaredoxin